MKLDQWKILEEELNQDFMRLLKSAVEEGWLGIGGKDGMQSDFYRCRQG